MRSALWCVVCRVASICSISGAGRRIQATRKMPNNVVVAAAASSSSSSSS